MSTTLNTPDETDIDHDDALFVREDDTVVDGSRFNVGDAFTKRWVLRNSGGTSWADGYTLRLVDGPGLGAPASVPVPPTAPGEEATLRVDFQPAEPTNFAHSEWRLANAENIPFGQVVWTEVVIIDPQAGSSAGQQSFPPPNSELIPVPTGAGAAGEQAARFWNLYGGLILDECNRLQIGEEDAVAVLLTESAGRPFDDTGRMVIRFENHLFWHYWGKANQERFRQHFQFNPEVTWQGHMWRPDAGGPWQPCHVNNGQEWQLLNFARSLDDTAALFSISMGAPQIMGFNHGTVGYNSPQAMFQAFEHDAGAQLRSLFRFMEKNNLVDDVQRKEYRQFALVYNGSGQPDHYAGIMQDYAAAFLAVRSRPAVAAAAAPPPPPPPTRPMAAPVAMDAPMAAGAPARTPPPAPLGTPMPASPHPGVPLATADPQLYEAWRTHIEKGFINNETMFKQVLQGFMNPYWSTVWMYRILFGVGISSFVVAALIALVQNNVVTTLIFGGLSVAAFLSFFIKMPLQALEENLQFITWLGIIYNTYWTALTQSQNPDTYNQDLTKATDDAIARIIALMDKHAERSAARPDAKEPDAAT